MHDITWSSLPQVTAGGGASPWGLMVEGGSWRGIQKGKTFSGGDAHFCPEVFSTEEGTWIVCLLC